MKLLVQAEEEYGFHNSGLLAIPCDELVFEDIIRRLAWSDSKKFTKPKENCHAGHRNDLDFWPESRPLLNGINEKSIW